MLATSSSLSLTPLTYLACRLWLFLLLLVLALVSCRSSEVIAQFSSSKVHLPRSFAVLINVLLIWLLLSVKFSVSSSTSLTNSLMSSSHLFFGLQIALLVLYFELCSFLHHLSLGDVAILIRQSPFHFL